MGAPQPISSFARIIGALKLGASAAGDLVESARECRCFNCKTPLVRAATPEDQQRLCDDCRDKLVDGGAEVVAGLVKRFLR